MYQEYYQETSSGPPPGPFSPSARYNQHPDIQQPLELAPTSPVAPLQTSQSVSNTVTNGPGSSQYYATQQSFASLADELYGYGSHSAPAFQSAAPFTSTNVPLPYWMAGWEVPTPAVPRTVLETVRSTPARLPTYLQMPWEPLPANDDAPVAQSPVVPLPDASWPGPGAEPEPEKEWQQCRCAEGPGTNPIRHWLSCDSNPNRTKDHECRHGCGRRATRRDNMRRHEKTCKLNPEKGRKAL